MAVERQFAFSRVAVRLMMAAGAAALMAGCSDASRFSDPFTNPFSGSSAKADRGVDGTPTASIPAPRASAPAALPSRVESKPLPATTAPVAQAPVAPAAPVAAAGGAGASHWTANGGTPVTVASGETAAMLATRYGVPTDALLHANGYSSAAQVQPGSRLIIPVYRAGAVTVASAAPAPVAAPAPPAKSVAPTAATLVKPEPKASAPVKPDPKALAAEKAKAEQAAKLAREEEAKQKKAEAEKIAAEKAAQAKKLADAREAEARKAAESKAAEAKAAAEKAKAAKAEAGKRADAAAKAEAAKAAKEAKLAQAEAAKAVKEAKSAEHAASAATATVEKAQPKAVAAAEKPVEPAPAVTAARTVDKTTTASIPPAAAAQEEATKVSTGGDPDRPEFRWPAHGRIIQGFSSGGNDGINIAVPEGTPVKAAEGGTVAYAGSELKGYGNLVLIRHPNGYVTAYAHNGQLDVKRGETVKRGQTIAKSGQTGNVGSPQLHFELRKGAQPIDPTSYLAGL